MINSFLTFMRHIFTAKKVEPEIVEIHKKEDPVKNKYNFGERSIKNINTLEPDLQMIVSKVMEWQVMDFTVICGVRTKEQQEDLVARGLSRTLNSKHLPNRFGMSEAVDIAPYPIDWNDHHAFHRLAGLMQAAASDLGVVIRWGGDWDGDNDTHDQSFIDLPHFELKGDYGV